MRTGPFSDPAVVTLINRYFIPLHLDNTDGSARRYGMEPGHENAYIILETPEIAGGPKVDTLILGTLTLVLEPANTRQEILKFLKKHERFFHPWPELKALETAQDPASRVKRVGLLLAEGNAEAALSELEGVPAAPGAAVLRARALRIAGRAAEARTALDTLGSDPESDMERIRLAVDRQEDDSAARMLDRFLVDHRDTPDAGEAYYLRGWLYHRAGLDARAIEIWYDGIARHPPTTSLFSQKARLTMIRSNWDLPANVDQPR